MEALLNREEIGRRAKALYEEKIRLAVGTDENIGKMIIIDAETGEYLVGDKRGLEAASEMRARRPLAPLFGIRIGYRTAEAIGGVLERTPR